MAITDLFRRRKRVPFAEWGHRVRDFALPTDGVVQFAQWQHPRVSEQAITQAEIDGLRRFVRPGDFAIDVGAHTGDSTVPLAIAAGAEGCVMALEPNPYVFKILQKNASLNAGRTRIAAHCFAATEGDGAFVFHYGDASYCNGGATPVRRWNLLKRTYPLSVAGRNLLRMLRTEYAQWLPKLSYVKVDAEGHDREILESILPVLRERRPVIRTEVFCNLASAERYRLYELLTGNGYDVFRYELGERPQGAKLERAEMAAEKHFDVIAVPRAGIARRAA